MGPLPLYQEPEGFGVELLDVFWCDFVAVGSTFARRRDFQGCGPDGCIMAQYRNDWEQYRNDWES